jgi:predicted lipid carrier protein YhbT
VRADACGSVAPSVKEDRNVATLEQCHQALERLSGRLASVDPESRQEHAFDRTISCHVPDLDTTFTGELRDGEIHDLTTEPAPKAQIRLTAASDDLVALTEGELGFGQAWLSGRVKVEAGVRDMLKLRSIV